MLSIIMDYRMVPQLSALSLALYHEATNKRNHLLTYLMKCGAENHHTVYSSLRSHVRLVASLRHLEGWSL